MTKTFCILYATVISFFLCTSCGDNTDLTTCGKDSTYKWKVAFCESDPDIASCTSNKLTTSALCSAFWWTFDKKVCETDTTNYKKHVTPASYTSKTECEKFDLTWSKQCNDPVCPSSSQRDCTSDKGYV